MRGSGPKKLPGEILSAARRLFIEQGYRGLSMRQIAEAVGVTKPALYYHFQDKEQLFLAVLYDYLAEMDDLVEQAVHEGGSAAESMVLLVRRIFDQPAEQRAVIRLANQEMGHLSEAAQAELAQAYQQKFLGKIQSLIQGGIDTGEFRPVDPPTAAWTLLGMMYPFFSNTRLIEASHPHAPAETVLTLYLQGLSSSTESGTA
jgi:AcrR family transcriptional regulator